MPAARDLASAVMKEVNAEKWRARPCAAAAPSARNGAPLTALRVRARVLWMVVSRAAHPRTRAWPDRLFGLRGFNHPTRSRCFQLIRGAKKSGKT
jgi:hypothetical protein